MIRRLGFTLVEILIGLAILAVLFSLLIPVLNTVMARSQTAKNMANMNLTMKDFFTWSTMNKGRMVNWGLPDDKNAPWWKGKARSDSTLGERQASYPALTVNWPMFLFHEFGEIAEHWQSTYRNPEGVLAKQAPNMSIEKARRIDPNWEWLLPTDYIYSETMITSPKAWVYPGLGFNRIADYAPYFASVLQADIAHPSNKGAVWLDHIEPGPGRQRLIAFADGAVAQRDVLSARPSAAHPLAGDPQRRTGAVGATLNGHLGVDW